MGLIKNEKKNFYAEITEYSVNSDRPVIIRMTCKLKIRNQRPFWFKIQNGLKFKILNSRNFPVDSIFRREFR